MDNTNNTQRLTTGLRALLVILAPLLSLSKPEIANAYTYYVNSVDGLDANDGTSQSTPWRTLAKVNHSKFRPGDNILFMAGDTWREELLISASGGTKTPIVLGAYGKGPSPIINGSDSITGWIKDTNAVVAVRHDPDWTKQPSQFGTIQRVTLAPDIWKAPVLTRPYAVWIDGTLSKGGGPGISSLTLPGEWYWDDGILYISSFTNLNNSAIESSHRETLLLNYSSFITFHNIHFDKGGNAYSGANSIVVRESEHISFINCQITNSVNIGINSYSPDATTGNMLIRGCQFSGTGESSHSSTTISNGAPSAIQTFNTGAFTTLTVEYSTFQDIDAWGAHHGHGVYDQSGNLIWRYNFHYGDRGTTDAGAGAGAAVRIGGQAAHSRIYGNVFTDNSGRRYWGVLATSGTNYIYNNIFLNNNYGVVTQGGTNKVISNSFLGTKTWWYVDDTGGHYSGNYNNFDGAQNGWIWNAGATLLKLETWRAASSQDSQSTEGPLISSSWDDGIE